MITSRFFANIIIVVSMIILGQCTSIDATKMQMRKDIDRYSQNVLRIDAPKHVLLAASILAKENFNYGKSITFLRRYEELDDPIVYLAISTLIIGSNRSNNEMDKTPYSILDAEYYYIRAAEKSYVIISDLSAIYSQKNSVFGYNILRAKCLNNLITQKSRDVGKCY